MGKKDEVSNVVGESEPSSFADIIKKNPSSAYTPEVKTSLDLALSFLSRIEQYGDGEWESILADGQVLVEVTGAEDNNSKTYKLILSKDPTLELKVGEDLDFTPTALKPEILVVSDGPNVNFRFQEEDFYSLEEDILDTGNIMSFICQFESCKDGILNWILVIKK